MGKVKIAILVTIVVALAWWGIAAHRQTQQQRRVIDAVRGLVEACKSQLAPGGAPIRGKALVWDVASDSRSAAHGRLPGDLKANGSDGQVTVFLVLGERTELVGTYSVSRQPAYRRSVDVCVAYWPEKQAAGLHSVVSADPRARRPVQQRPEYGDPNEPIAAWIAALPRS